MDRNNTDSNIKICHAMTFPARGTWIEIAICARASMSAMDVPRKGNVDRNKTDYKNQDSEDRRSPQGERG